MLDGLTHIVTIDLSAGRYSLVAVATLIAGYTDASWYRISNAVTVPLMVSGLLYHTVLPGERGLLFTLLGAGTGFCILAGFLVVGGVGAGDVKLLTGIGAWIGPHDVLVVFIVAGLLVGVYSLAIIAWTTKWTELPHRIASDCRGLMTGARSPQPSVEQVATGDERTRRRKLVPLGTMIAIALFFLIIGNLEVTGPRDYSATTTPVTSWASISGPSIPHSQTRGAMR